MAQPRRTKKFIDTNVQGALARRIIFHWLVFLAVASLASFILQVLSNPFRPLVAHAQDIWWTHGPFLLVLVFLLPVFVVDTIKISHRFAGPVFALRRAIREIVQGKPPRKLKFRRHDFWHDLAEDYNAMLLRLQLLDDEADVEPAVDEQPAGSNK
jgi:cytochrome b subunit of formate dehydrogenase